MQDGMMSGQGFMQRLRDLTPLQRQVTPSPQMQLVESEDEDEELRDDRREDEGRYLNHEEEQDGYDDEDGYGKGGYSAYHTSTSVAGQAGSRKYALYQADDEEESDDGYDDRDSSRPNAQHRYDIAGGAAHLHKRQDSHGVDGYYPQTHHTTAQGDAQRYTERSRNVQEEMVHEAPDAYDHISNDDDEGSLEHLLSAHRDNPASPPPLPVVQRPPNLSNSEVQRGKIDVELSKSTSSEQKRVVQVHAQLPERASERSIDSWRQSVDDVAKEEQAEEEDEVVDEVVWEMGEESEVDAPAELRAVPNRQTEEWNEETHKTGNGNSNGMQEESKVIPMLSPSAQLQQQQLEQESICDTTNALFQGFYESQRIEDLDVVGLSQWASPPRDSRDETTTVSVTAAAVETGLVGGVDVADVAADMRAKEGEDKAVTAEEGQGEGAGLTMEVEEDDISCLEVEGFDY